MKKVSCQGKWRTGRSEQNVSQTRRLEKEKSNTVSPSCLTIPPHGSILYVPTTPSVWNGSEEDGIICDLVPKQASDFAE